MKKKLLLTTLALTLVTGLLAGCGSNSSDNNNSSTSNDNKAEEQVTLRYAHWGSVADQEMIDGLISEFEQENPNIKVKQESTPWKEYWTKMETSITGKNAPDVFMLNIPRSTDYINNGIIVPLDDLNLDLSKYPKVHVEAYTKDGKVYGIPRDYDTIGLFYNKTLFDEAGVEYPTNDWTWDDLLVAAEKLTNKEKGTYGLAAPIEWQGGYYETIFQNDGYVFSKDATKSGFDDPKTIEAIEYWAQFIQKGYSPSVEQLATTKQSEYLLSGKLAMMYDGSWMVSTLFEDEYGKANIDVAELPKGVKKATTSNALANVVYSGSKNIDAAKKWVEFLSSKHANEVVASAGLVITSYEGTQQKWLETYPDKNLRAFIDSVEFAVPLPNIPNGSAATAIEGEILTQGWMGEMPLKDACLKVAEEANKILEKNKK